MTTEWRVAHPFRREGRWTTLPRGTGLHLNTIETRGVPDPFGV
jgi:hypothetical protein